MASEVLLRIILTELDREIAGWSVDAAEIASERWKPHGIGTDWHRLRLRYFRFRKCKKLLLLTVGGVF
jgi:hypothetical protein